MPLDKSPLVVKEFKGTLVTDIDAVLNKYTQGQIPFEYALNSENLEYMKKGGMRTRKGIENFLALNNIIGTPVQFWRIDTLNGIDQTDRYLIMTLEGANGCRLYDTQVAAPATNPILGLITSSSLAIINAFNRIYISLQLGFNPLEFQPTITNQYLYVYNGLYNARGAGAIKPVIGTFTATVAATGNMTVGLHLASVLYETDSGFITNFPNTTGTTFTITAGNNKVNFTNIPVGPTGTAKRHIVITKVIVNDNGQGFNSYEPFFAVKIDDNTTTIASYDKPDSGLVDSAKDQLDAPERLYPCTNFAVYNNRMVYLGLANTTSFAGGPDNQHVIAVSPVDKPEQIDQIVITGNTFTGYGTSFIPIGPEFLGAIQTGAELNSAFYIFKEDSTFSIIDNPDLDPNEWDKPRLVDAAKGAFPRGLCLVGNNPSALNDGVLVVAGNHGISTFNGTFSQQSIADGIWEEYRSSDLRLMKLINDPIRKTLILRLGGFNEDGVNITSVKSYVLTANYYYGSDITTLRWGKWKYGTSKNNQILIRDILFRKKDTSGLARYDSPYPLYIALHAEYVSGTIGAGALFNTKLLSESVNEADFQETSQVASDKNYPFWIYETGYTPNEHGEIYTFGPLKLRINSTFDTNKGFGNGTLEIDKALLDESNMTLASLFATETYPKRFMSTNLNIVGEQIRLKIMGQNRAFIHGLYLFFTKKAEERVRS